MRCARLIALFTMLAIYPAEGRAQSDKAETERWATIRFLNHLPLDKRLRVTLKNHQPIEGDFDKTFYDYFIVTQNGVPRTIPFSDVETIAVPRKGLKRLGRVAKISLYTGAALVGIPGAAIFSLYCALDPNHCR